MNKTQLQTSAASLIGVLAGYAAGHGWLGLSASDWTTILGALVSIGAVVWPLVAARGQSLKDTVGHMEKTTVITDAASAAALPNNPDVIAATPAIVQAVNVAKASQ